MTNRPMSIDEAIALAQTWAKQGVPAGPIGLSWDHAAGKVHKRPLTRGSGGQGGFKRFTTDAEMIRRQYNGATLKPGEELGVGLWPGPAGLIVLDPDIDPKTGDKIGVDNLAELEAEHGELPPHPIVITVSGGEHHTLPKRPDTHVGNSDFADHIEVRSDAGYVVAAGTHCSWGGWKRSPASGPLPSHEAVPDWVYERLNGVTKGHDDGATGHWARLDPEQLHPADRAALEALLRLGGHDPYIANKGDKQYVMVARAGRHAAGCSVGFIGPGVAKMFHREWWPLRQGVSYDADRLMEIADAVEAGDRELAEELADPNYDADRLASSYERNEFDEEKRSPGGVSSSNSSNSYSDDEEWPELHPDALYGPAGEAVELLRPHTEADPAAVLATLLAGWGGIVGSGPHAKAGHAPHPPRLSVVVVGDTAKARKGTSWSTARLLLEHVDHLFLIGRVLGGFGSGEAVVDEVRDPNPDDENDRGAPDKRLLIHEPEFARVLKVCTRETSVLSAIIRDAWDGTRLQTRARVKKAVASGHHIVIVGHITAPELRRNLTETEIAGGFANRLLWVCARRSQRLPFGSEPDPADLARLGKLLTTRAADARKIGLVSFADDDEEVRDLWAQLYDEMAEDDPGGMLGAIVARPEPQTLRLALTYALLDGQRCIGAAHIRAAWALWQYSRASAAYIWGDAVGDEIADRLLRAIRRAGGDGLDLTEQSAEFGRNVSAKRLATARTELERRGLIETVQVPPKGGRGKPRTVSRAVRVTNRS